MKLTLFLLAGFFIFSCAEKRGGDTRDYVNDEVGLLTAAQRGTLRNELIDIGHKVGPQVVILIIGSLDGENIDDYSLRTANEWGIGRKGRDDGVLITVAVAERQVRIEVGRGLERTIEDDVAARIIRDEVAPRFREERYFEGLRAAIGSMRALMERGSDANPGRP